MARKSTAEGGLRERKKRATRDALVEAAVRLAAEHGAERVTVEAISDAAGVSTRTFFNYFDSRDDAFVMIGAEANARVRQAVLAAPPGLSPLQVLRDAIAAELAEVEERHELWSLHAMVLRTSPRLLVRALGVHTADERELAEVLAERIDVGSRSSDRATPSASEDERRNPTPRLYPRLLAAVGVTAVRVAVEHWCERPDGVAFGDVFHDVFEHLAAGLPAPAEETGRN
ncbi:TetR/AcrR family transcriptional regulator [Streptomyces muensis]|uniref:TetR/AcrR family transcriptional regulator n=2 Tax=Streptomyces muensis TaxID=1077944 RepID=A0A9X1TV08_STRM4|nr:TetR/AcrR family transcriptional regulator [Streptomyces muensis]MCF1596953.1 TetR/AcrR family transcriptional regulator [Streptomyces muensis]